MAKQACLQFHGAINGFKFVPLIVLDLLYQLYREYHAHQESLIGELVTAEPMTIWAGLGCKQCLLGTYMKQFMDASRVNQLVFHPYITYSFPTPLRCKVYRMSLGWLVECFSRLDVISIDEGIDIQNGRVTHEAEGGLYRSSKLSNRYNIRWVGKYR